MKEIVELIMDKDRAFSLGEKGVTKIEDLGDRIVINVEDEGKKKDLVFSTTGFEFYVMMDVSQDSVIATDPT